MRRKQASKRGRVIPILVAAIIGYVVGSWNTAIRSTQASDASTAAQTIAMRFPRELSNAPVVQAASFRSAADNTLVNNAQLALFEPEPMLAPTAPQLAGPQPAAQADAQQPPVQTADIGPPPPLPVAPKASPIAPKPKELTSAAKPRPAPVHREVKRPGYLLDDAQIADIKRRLHLTPDQEQMWPAVAAALRNIGYQREREALARGAAPAIDPESPQVQDLKSAAIPLLMSFSDEQKDEVRSLARGMGLDRLASEF